MHIVFQHSTRLPVLKYGGTERIVFWLMKELASLGHNVTLIGHPESDVEKFGIALIPKKENWQEQIPCSADIVHLSSNQTLDKDFPTLVMIQGNGKPGEIFPQNTVFLSKKHAQNHGAKYFIYNALDFSEYPFYEKKSSWENFLFLAKASWKVKNLKSCLKACKKNKRHLHIAGGRALMPSRFVHNYGMVGGSEKHQLIQKCDALLWPVRWHEPFGIAVIEAMAYGLFVIASPYGSLPELINPQSGKIVQSEKELIDFMRAKPSFSPSKIRKYVEENFSITRLAKDYLKAYEKILRGETLNAKNPSWKPVQESEILLDF